ncbi:hypothetical protein [Halostella salina]|uniref:hypothetical protein n=1 Tax=Halostella salina TaxID=1547897 RepID=UPI000EF7F8F3|nr:hypothetical protein [Halostella salina]
MVTGALRRLFPVRDGPAGREFVAVGLLLLASLILQRVLRWGVDAVSVWSTDALGGQLVGAAVYTALGLAALAAGYAVVRRGTSWDGLGSDGVVSAGGGAGLVLFAVTYQLHGVAALPAFPGSVVPALLVGGVAMGLLPVAYARARGVDVRFAPPDRDALPVAALTALVAALAGTGWVVALAALGNPLFVSPVGVTFGPGRSAGVLLWDAAVPGALVGVGMGVLYNGAVQEGLREHVGPAGAVAAATALVGISVVELRVGAAAGPVPTAASTATVVLLALLGALLAANGSRVLAAALDGDLPTAGAATVGVLVVALPLAVATAVRATTDLFAVYGVALAVTAAAAAVGYERTRSAWVPGLAFAAYRIVTANAVALWLAGIVQ